MSPYPPVLPPTDGSMWRRALARVHPDAGGDDALFVWLMNVRDTLGGGALRFSDPSSSTSSSRTVGTHHERINYDGSLEFFELTSRALSVGQSVEEPYRSMLRLLIDCVEVDRGHGYTAQYQGATYKQLAYIGHLVGLDGPARHRWYAIAEGIPLAARHATHIIQKEKVRNS
ncbi:MAG: hypothetical protein JOZ19_11860, partial [Rubrobacter sp.]|nr:hypothetical protein [Rubrobacter sp.]